MKKTTKIASAILTAVLLVSCAGCNGNQETYDPVDYTPSHDSLNRLITFSSSDSGLGLLPQRVPRAPHALQ